MCCFHLRFPWQVPAPCTLLAVSVLSRCTGRDITSCPGDMILVSETSTTPGKGGLKRGGKYGGDTQEVWRCSAIRSSSSSFCNSQCFCKALNRGCGLETVGPSIITRWKSFPGVYSAPETEQQESWRGQK